MPFVPVRLQLNVALLLLRIVRCVMTAVQQRQCGVHFCCHENAVLPQFQIKQYIKV